MKMANGAQRSSICRSTTRLYSSANDKTSSSSTANTQPLPLAHTLPCHIRIKFYLSNCYYYITRLDIAISPIGFTAELDVSVKCVNSGVDNIRIMSDVGHPQWTRWRIQNRWKTLPKYGQRTEKYYGFDSMSVMMVGLCVCHIHTAWVMCL